MSQKVGIETGGPGLNPGFTSVCLWVSRLTSVRLNLIYKMELIHSELLSAKWCGGFKASGMMPGPFQTLKSTTIGKQARETGETGLPTGNHSLVIAMGSPLNSLSCTPALAQVRCAKGWLVEKMGRRSLGWMCDSCWSRQKHGCFVGTDGRVTRFNTWV